MKLNYIFRYAFLLVFTLFSEMAECQIATYIILENGDTINKQDSRGRQGIWREYKGKRVLKEVHYINNHLNGDAIYYFRKNHYKKEFYVNDVSVDTGYYYKNDELSSLVIKDSTGRAVKKVFYRKNRQTKCTIEYLWIDEQVAIPVISTFYRSGKPKKKSTIINNSDIEIINFKRNGKIR